jgi:hypothetical protein
MLKYEKEPFSYRIFPASNTKGEKRTLPSLFLLLKDPTDAKNQRVT